MSKQSAKRPLGSHNRRLTREQLDEPRIALLFGGRPALLHVGVAKGPRPGRTLCSDQTMFQHPVFARDPMFGPGWDSEHRHAYALAVMELNAGSTCEECIKAMIEAGGYTVYPYLDPVKAG